MRSPFLLPRNDTMNPSFPLYRNDTMNPSFSLHHEEAAGLVRLVVPVPIMESLESVSVRSVESVLAGGSVSSLGSVNPGKSRRTGSRKRFHSDLCLCS